MGVCMSTQPVFLFPGQGSQSIGMGKDLYQEFPDFARTIEEASDILNFDVKTLCFEDPDAKLNLTEFTQPAILAVSTGIARVLQSCLDLTPTLVAGHSLGEYSALVSLGALKFSDALKAVRFRGQAMQRAVPVGIGAMAAYLGEHREEVIALCKEISTPENKVEIANDNCPTQLVLSGHTDAVEQVCKVISEKKLGRGKKLAVSAPFHSSLMSPAAQEMAEYFNHIKLNNFDGKIIANINAEVQTSATYSIEMLIGQIASPVLWTQTMKTLHDKDAQVWIEVGPGKVLQGLAKKTFESQKCLITNNVAGINAIQST